MMKLRVLDCNSLDACEVNLAEERGLLIFRRQIDCDDGLILLVHFQSFTEQFFRRLFVARVHGNAGVLELG